MGRNLASGKRPTAKLKVMAKMGENLFRTTKIYRMLAMKPPGTKAKWGTFLQNNQEEYNAWRAWWNSPQSARWKNIEGGGAKPPPGDSDDGQSR